MMTKIFSRGNGSRRALTPLAQLAAALLLVTLLLAWVAAPAQAAGPITRVMTRNMDTGTDFGPLFGAQTATDFMRAVTKVYQEVQASNVPERAAGIAREIALSEPDLVSLQEVDLWRTGPTTVPSRPAQTTQIDALAALMSALAALGQHYQVIASSQEFDVRAPSSLGFDVRVTDYDVILMNKKNYLSYTNSQSHQYATVLMAPTPVGTVPFPQGWASADVTAHGQAFRFIATHLSVVPPIQTGQAQELLHGPVNTSLPVVLAGDFNLAAVGGPGTTGTYPSLLAAGMVDTWSLANPGVPGYTWPLHGEDPYTPATTPTERLDLILIHGGLGVRDAVLVDTTTPALTPSGLWPSDHAGVLASVRLGSRGNSGSGRQIISKSCAGG